MLNWLPPMAEDYPKKGRFWLDSYRQRPCFPLAEILDFRHVLRIDRPANVRPAVEEVVHWSEFRVPLAPAEYHEPAMDLSVDIPIRH